MKINSSSMFTCAVLFAICFVCYPAHAGGVYIGGVKCKDISGSYNNKNIRNLSGVTPEVKATCDYIQVDLFYNRVTDLGYYAAGARCIDVLNGWGNEDNFRRQGTLGAAQAVCTERLNAALAQGQPEISRKISKIREQIRNDRKSEISRRKTEAFINDFFDKIPLMGGVLLGLLVLIFLYRRREAIYTAFISHPAEPPIKQALTTNSTFNTPEIENALTMSETLLNNPPLALNSKVKRERLLELRKLIEEEARIAGAALNLERARALKAQAEKIRRRYE